MPPTATPGKKRGRGVALEVDPTPVAAPNLPNVCYLPSAGGAQAAGLSGDGSDPSKRPRWTVYSKVRPRLPTLPALQLVHGAADVGGVAYQGVSNSDEYGAPLSCSYALGLYDPEAGRLRLMPVAGATVFRLEPRVPGLPYTAAGTGANDEMQTAEERMLANKSLVDKFGSTRRKRQMVAREEGIVRVDKISGSAQVAVIFQDAVAKGATQGLTREAVLQRAFEGRTVPPHNPDATMPRAAYPLELLLGSAALVSSLDYKRMLDLAKHEDKEEEARTKNWVPAYVLGRLRLLRNEPDKSKQKQTARYLALLAALIKLTDMRTIKEDAGVTSRLRLREELLEELLNRFYVKVPAEGQYGARYERPDAQGKLLQATMLAVAVAVEDGILSEHQFDELRRLLRTDAAKLADVLAQLGCVMRRSDIKAEEAAEGVAVPAYAATLLRNASQPGKTLRDSFPQIKLPKAKGKGK